nr:hypothetical protein [Microbispora rosea]
MGAPVAVAVAVAVADPAEGGAMYVGTAVGGEVVGGAAVGGGVEVCEAGEVGTLGVALTEPVGDVVAGSAGD